MQVRRLDTHQCVSFHAASVRVATFNRAVKRKYGLIPPSTCLARPDNALLRKKEKKMRTPPYRAALSLLTQKTRIHNMNGYEIEGVSAIETSASFV